MGRGPGRQHQKDARHARRIASHGARVLEGRTITLLREHRKQQLAVTSGRARSRRHLAFWRRRTGIEPADGAERRPPVLKTGAASLLGSLTVVPSPVLAGQAAAASPPVTARHHRSPDECSPAVPTTLGQAGYRLRGAQVQRLLDYTWLEGRDPGGKDYTESPAFLAASGFRELLAPSAAGAGSCGNPGAMIDGHPEYAQCWGLTL